MPHFYPNKKTAAPEAAVFLSPYPAGEGEVSVESFPFSRVVAAVDGDSPFSGVYAGAVFEADAAASDGGAFDVHAVGDAIGFTAEFIFVGQACVVLEAVVLMLPPGAYAGQIAFEAVDVVVAAGFEGVSIQVGVEEAEVRIQAVSMAPVGNPADTHMEGVVQAVCPVPVRPAQLVVEDVLCIVGGPAHAEGRFSVESVGTDIFPEDSGAFVVDFAVSGAPVEGAVGAIAVVIGEAVFPGASLFGAVLPGKARLSPPEVCGDVAPRFIAVFSATHGAEGFDAIGGLIQVLHGVQDEIIGLDEGRQSRFLAQQGLMGLGLPVHIRPVYQVSVLQ